MALENARQYLLWVIKHWIEAEAADNLRSSLLQLNTNAADIIAMILNQDEHESRW